MKKFIHYCEPLGDVYDNTFVQLFMPLSATKAVIYTVGGGIGQELAIEVTHLVLHQPLVYVAQCDTNLVCFCMLLIKSFFREAILHAWTHWQTLPFQKQPIDHACAHVVTLHMLL